MRVTMILAMMTAGCNAGSVAVTETPAHTATMMLSGTLSPTETVTSSPTMTPWMAPYVPMPSTMPMRSCTSPPVVPAGYRVDPLCMHYTRPHYSTCNVTGCKPRYDDYYPHGTYKCLNGTWVEWMAPQGCTAIPAGSCGTTTVSGTTCQQSTAGQTCRVMCAQPGYTRRGGDQAVCTNETWDFSGVGPCESSHTMTYSQQEVYDGATSNEPAMCAYDPQMAGYIMESGCASWGREGKLCKALDCAPGYFPTPGATFNGSLKCRFGKWRRNQEFTGCELASSGPGPASCSAPPFKPGYKFECNSSTPDGGSCNVTCDTANNYGGRVGGHHMCIDGTFYTDLLYGCAPMCMFDPSICVNGELLNGLRLRGSVKEARVDEMCRLDTGGRLGVARFECKDGYRLSSSTFAKQQSAAVCVSGTFVGGYKRWGAPTCVHENDPTAIDDLTCGCGVNGLLKATASRAVRGLTRNNTEGSWMCTLVNRRLFCTCRCVPP